MYIAQDHDLLLSLKTPTQIAYSDCITLSTLAAMLWLSLTEDPNRLTSCEDYKGAIVLAISDRSLPNRERALG